MALLITESLNLGKGGIIYYNGGSSDYQKLKNAAAKLNFYQYGRGQRGWLYVGNILFGKEEDADYSGV